MKLKQVKFRENVDVRGSFNSGVVAGRGIDLFRAPNGDVIITWEGYGGVPEDQVIVGHANVVFSKPFERIKIPADAAEAPAKPEAKAKPTT